MGRYDALTQLDKKPEPTTPPPADPPAADPPVVENEVVSLPPKQPAGTSPTYLHANVQAGKPASVQTSKPTSMQTCKPASLQTGKQVNLQTGKQALIEKYSSYLTHDYKRELKRIAFESDRSEYEILMEAVELYLTSRKRQK